jgi:competence transcription factor ComK
MDKSVYIDSKHVFKNASQKRMWTAVNNSGVYRHDYPTPILIKKIITKFINSKTHSVNIAYKSSNNKVYRTI